MILLRLPTTFTKLIELIATLPSHLAATHIHLSSIHFYGTPYGEYEAYRVCDLSLASLQIQLPEVEAFSKRITIYFTHLRNLEWSFESQRRGLWTSLKQQGQATENCYRWPRLPIPPNHITPIDNHQVGANVGGRFVVVKIFRKVAYTVFKQFGSVVPHLGGDPQILPRWLRRCSTRETGDMLYWQPLLAKGFTVWIGSIAVSI